MGYSYDFGYYGDEYIIEEMMTGFGFALLGVLAVILLIVLVVGIGLYVLSSLGFYSIAKRRGIRNAWLSWVPVGNYWILGSISDQYQYVVKGKVTNRRKMMLVLGLCSAMLSGALNGVRTALLITGAEEAAFAGGALVMISALAGTALTITLLVFYYMSLYDLYTSVSPQNNVLFLVLSIIFRITEPFFIFFNRKKDDGMPPRREVPPTYIPEPVTPVQEPWESPEV